MVTALISALRPATYAEYSAANIGHQRADPPWLHRTKIIASGKEISSVILAWSGLQNLWADHKLGGRYNFFNDVVMLCEGLGIDIEDWGESPLKLGSNYTVLIHDPELARSQMAETVYELIEERLSGGYCP